VATLYPHWNRGARWPVAVGVVSPRWEGAPGPAREGRKAGEAARHQRRGGNRGGAQP
jgi:hypothetical protein